MGMAFARQNWLFFPSTDRMFLIQTTPRYRRKSRVGNSRHNPSGRRWGRGLVCSMSTLSSRRYTYQSVPGRSGWPSRDPFHERGGRNLYGFVFNEPIGKIDALGLACIEAIGKSGHPLMAFTDPGGGWAKGKAEFGGKAGSNPGLYTTAKVQYEANVTVLCKCNCGYQQRNGLRIDEETAYGDWPFYNPGTVGIGIEIPTFTGVLQGLGKLGAKWINSVIGAGVMVQEEVDNAAAEIARLPHPTNPWDGSWKGGKSPCEK